MKPLIKLTLLLCLQCLTLLLAAQTIAEKKAGIIVPTGDLSPEMAKLLVQVNDEISSANVQLRSLYRQVQEMYQEGAPETDYLPILEKINHLKENIAALENSWRESAAMPERGSGYSLWYQPETTVGQLINDYGSHSYIYVASAEIAKIKISVDSNLPIPRASWDEVLEMILNQSGVGIRQLNSFLRELYWLDVNHSNLELITNSRNELELMPSRSQVAFMLSPEPSEVKRIWLFLDRFVNANTTSLQIIGREILIIGSVAEVQDLLRIYDFASTHRGDKEYKVLPVRKVDVEEMANILGAIFDIGSDQSSSRSGSRSMPREGMPPRGPQGGGRGPGPGPGPGAGPAKVPPPPMRESRSADMRSGGGGNEPMGGLRIIPLRNIAQAIFLVGTREEIRKAEEIIHQVESQVGEAREKTIYWYTAKHSDPEELAQVLERIYFLLVTTRAEREAFVEDMASIGMPEPMMPPPPPLPLQASLLPPAQRGIYEEGYFLTDRFIVNPDPPMAPRAPPNQGRDNFIVDLKSGAIVMVLEIDLLPQIKELLRKLDVPKKMVQIECMLFEKVVERENDMGLNLLQMGSLASNTNATSLTYGAGIAPASQVANSPISPLIFALVPQNGITDFIISRTKSSGIPAYDAFYRFLISRDDIQINATPSLLTVNQTEATIEIEEEISVNTGIFIIQDAGEPTLKDSFARARYGIKITVIPTIHMADPESDDETNYVTLDSEIKFETFVNNFNSRPDVTRRMIQNEARIADGQTVIIGGLRRKDTDDHKTAIPFLGEIPGIGKLFSQSSQHEKSTEMFIFLTPKIITDPSDELECLKMQEVVRRPGDIPAFLANLVQAEEAERNRLFNGTMTMLFGREPDRVVDDEGCQYDGR